MIKTDQCEHPRSQNFPRFFIENQALLQIVIGSLHDSSSPWLVLSQPPFKSHESLLEP